MKTKCADCCFPETTDPEACGCCEGVDVITPLSTYNRPGLSAIRYRIGAHGDFLETMTAKLTGYSIEADPDGESPRKTYPLQGLTSRNQDDPSMALLDAWAVVADVLTFYQERLANEGYLRTATERRSVLELARLVGYRPRPGVAASVFLAYSLDQNFEGETVIPAGSLARSIPGPGELPQSFETSEDLRARTQWNNLRPRMTRPQTAATIMNGAPDSAVEGPRLYLKGINTNLKANAPLLIDFGNGQPVFRRVKEVLPDATADHTLVLLVPETIIDDGGDGGSNGSSPVFEFGSLIGELTLSASKQPANSLRLTRKLESQFVAKTETGYQTLTGFAPQLQGTLALAAANAEPEFESGIKVYALRSEAKLFGHNVPKRTRILDDGTVTIIGDWPIIEAPPIILSEAVSDAAVNFIFHEEETGTVIYLDARYDNILPDAWMVVDVQETRLTAMQTLIVTAQAVETNRTRSEYGMTAPTTRIELGASWINLEGMEASQVTDNDFNALRSTVVYAQPELLELAEEPIEIPVCGGANKPIELDGFYSGLEAGRWVVISGERKIAGTSGVRFSELAMLSSVTQDTAKEEMGIAGADGTVERVRPGETIHSFITLANDLAYCFKRDTVTIYGNVVKATHGETRHEVLGAGDGSKPFQAFELKQFPLTHVSASNPAGTASTLKVFVNDIQWQETDSLAGSRANDRHFISKTDNESKTTVIFGNGDKGLRLPTGVENIRAEYRNGIGAPGNVKAQQISLLVSKPSGVKEVINPLRASGGADKETRDQARKHVPLAVKALDRLVSVRDYEDFSRVFAGVGKAHAVEISNGRNQIVHVTIAGAGDIPIDPNSDLFVNLRRALYDFGDPQQVVELAVRELMFIVIEAGVAILPDYQWESVVLNLREALLDAFSFERRELGQDVVLSEVVGIMQNVPGVAYVDVDAFGGIPEKIADETGQRRLLTPDEIAEAVDCLATRWSSADMETKCSGETGDPECEKYRNCKKYGVFGTSSGVRQRLPVNTAGLDNGNVRPAQLAFLSPEVPATLILNQIERLP